jgi:pentatricopeptide repeat protein
VLWHLARLGELDVISYQRYLRAYEAVREANNTSCEADLVALMSKVDATTLIEYNHLMHTLTKVRNPSCSMCMRRTISRSHRGLLLCPPQMRYKPQVQMAGIELLGRMRDRGIHPDAVTYTTFINLLKKDRDADKAWLVFRRMRDENVRPNEWTYSAMAHICAQKRYRLASQRIDAYTSAVCCIDR